MSKAVILTGLRANNDLHLGNYLGALLPLVQLQKKYAGEYQINLFVPDLHSFTTPVDHAKLLAQTQHNLALFVASGLDITNKNTYLYRQSYIPAHSEATVILNCFTYMGEMKRMTQFKEKSQNSDSVSVGLFDYPVLMAADILLYGAKYVPVGDDQTQHVEIARDIALRINEKFNSQIFVPPAPVKEQLTFSGQIQRLRIRDLTHPEKKMSKSSDSSKGVVFLGDSPEAAKKKIMSATTDSYGKIAYDYQTQPGVSNLIEILAALSNRTLKDVCDEFVGQTQYGALKTATANAVSDFLQDFQSKLMAVDRSAIENKLSGSEKAMNSTAQATLYRLQSAVGLRPKLKSVK